MDMRNLPIDTPADMRKLFKEMGLDYDRHTKEAAQVKNAIEKVKVAEAKAQRTAPQQPAATATATATATGAPAAAAAELSDDLDAFLDKAGLTAWKPHFEKAGIHTATQMRALPTALSDMRKLFKRMDVNYDRKSASQVQKAIANAKKRERPAPDSLKPSRLDLG